MKDNAISVAYKAVLDMVPAALLRGPEKEVVKNMVDWFYGVNMDDEIQVVRENQIHLQEVFTQLHHVVAVRVLRFEQEYAPVRQAVEDEIMASGKKTTVDQRELMLRTHEECSKHIATIEQGHQLLENFKKQLTVCQNRFQLILESGYDARRFEKENR